jgi:uncharacterized protein
MIPDLHRAISLQDLDDRIDRLKREIAALPVHIAQIEQQLDSHLRRLDQDKDALLHNQKERKRIEQENQTQEQKISKLRDQMMSAKTNDQYRAFQHEIEFCQKTISKGEDQILELMAESEPLEQAVTRAEQELETEKRQVEAEKQQARERTGIAQSALNGLETERATLAGEMDAWVLGMYERLRKRYKGGKAVAETLRGTCSVCHMALRPQFFQELNVGAKVLNCESCGRILYVPDKPASFEGELAREHAKGTRVNMS